MANRFEDALLRRFLHGDIQIRKERRNLVRDGGLAFIDELPWRSTGEHSGHLQMQAYSELIRSWTVKDWVRLFCALEDLIMATVYKMRTSGAPEILLITN